MAQLADTPDRAEIVAAIARRAEEGYVFEASVDLHDSNATYVAQRPLEPGGDPVLHRIPVEADDYLDRLDLARGEGYAWRSSPYGHSKIGLPA